MDGLQVLLVSASTQEDPYVEVPYVTANGTGNASEYTFLDDEESPPKDDDHARSLAQKLWIFCGPVIFIIGMCGNVLILLVMRRKRMRGTTTCVFLRLMAFADICVLITGMIPEWLEHVDLVVFKKIHPACCKLEKFSFYTSADTAIWILVIFTVDRFIAVCFPLSKKDYCVPSKAKLFALAALLLAIAKNLHVFWTRGAEYVTENNSTFLLSNCGRPTAEYKYFEKYIRPWIAFTLVSVVPFCVIIVCNVFIIRALIVVKRMRSEQAITATSDKAFVQMSAMCLSASFCFLVCITPSVVLNIGRPYWKTDPWYEIVKAINNQLVYVNHSANFFLYCVTGKRFRHELVGVCRRKDASLVTESMDSRTTMYRHSVSPGTIHQVKNGGNNTYIYSKLEKDTRKLTHMNRNNFPIHSKSSQSSSEEKREVESVI